MRLWLTLLCAAACFSEPSSPTTSCPVATPGCDCNPDDTCDESLECIVSIDKCVPVDCTPGTHTCTCTDASTCDSPFECSGGVCIDPTPDSTGGSASTSTTTSMSTDASATTSGTSTGASDTLTTDPTSLTTAVTDTLDSTTTIDPSDPTLPPEATSASDTMSIACPGCLEESSTGMCSKAYQTCQADNRAGGCSDLSVCIIQGEVPESCCEMNNGTPPAHLLWNAFAECARNMECGQECVSTCGL